MERTALPRRLVWQLGRVVDIVDETPRTKSLVLDVPAWASHRAGQLVDVRLTAEDGYQTERSYSLASPPEERHVVLTVERLDDGEVSPYLTDGLQAGDQLELRGPIGGYFTWQVADGGPLLLIAGGSGIVPLMAMLRHRAARQSTVPTRLLYSSRAFDEIIYRQELAQLAAADTTLMVTHTLTRRQPPDWAGYGRRIDRAMLAEVAWPPSAQPQAFVCGPTALVETVASALVELGHDPLRVKTERFGPSGGTI
ncbi:MAG: ferredoxin reductase [Roseiflexaceae bacterium]